MTVIVHEKLASEPLRLNHEARRAIRSESDNLANDTIARDFNRREMTFRVERKATARGNQRYAARAR